MSKIDKRYSEKRIKKDVQVYINKKSNDMLDEFIKKWKALGNKGFKNDLISNIIIKEITELNANLDK